MALRRLRPEPPKLQAVVDAKGRVSQSWSAYFDAVGRPINCTDVDVAYDPPNIGAGAYVRVSVPTQGVRRGNFVAASFDQGAADIALISWVSADDQVTVMFWNVSGAGVDLAAGTLRVRYWSHNP